MQTYLVFMKNKTTGEEFVVPHNGMENSHERMKIELRATYPANKFDIFTAYTLEDLENTLTETKRWPGVASKPQKEAVRNRLFAVSTAMPKATKADSIEAMLKAKTAQTPIKSSLKVAPSMAKPAGGESVITMLKSMRAS